MKKATGLDDMRPFRLIRNLLRGALKQVLLFRSHEFRITAHDHDLVRSAPRHRGPSSPLRVYLTRRHEQIEHFGLGPASDVIEARWVYETYYGKVDRIALVRSSMRSALTVPGDAAEFGVFRGDTAKAMTRNSRSALLSASSISSIPSGTCPRSTIGLTVGGGRETFPTPWRPCGLCLRTHRALRSSRASSRMLPQLRAPPVLVLSRGLRPL